MVDKINDELEIDMGTDSENQELSLNDFKGKNFLKKPEVGETLIFEVLRLENNKNTKGSANGQEFVIGLKDKNEKVIRTDIITTEEKTYTIDSWELFFKLLGNKKDNEGLLITYAKEHNGSFKGAKLSIKRLYNGYHATQNENDLMKIMGFKTKDQLKVYRAEVIKAKDEKRLYEVKLI